MVKMYSEEPDISNLWRVDSIGIKPEHITHEEAFVLEHYIKKMFSVMMTNIGLNYLGKSIDLICQQIIN